MTKTASLVALVLFCVPTIAFCGSADEIIKEAGLNGGVVVHLGCGDGKMTVDLHLSDAFLVHGLDADVKNVAAARKHIISVGLHGKVTVEQWSDKTLPFGDNVVNLVVVEDAGSVFEDEILRTLCPDGVAMIKSDGKWRKLVKPRPDDIDEWTHFLYDASNNAVAKDERIGPPRRLQWTAGPQHTRDHDALASMSAMTSSNGRVFYILDEGPTSLIHRPSKWKLIARDAFNGKLLWKRDIPVWITQLANFRAGPAQITRRLVSIGDKVFVTLGLDAPIVMLDAASGKTLHTFKGSQKAEELICHDGKLLVVIGDPDILTDAATTIEGYWILSMQEKKPVAKRIVAYNVEDGEVAWEKSGENLSSYATLSLIAHGDKACYLDGEELHALDFNTGKELWTAPFETQGRFVFNYSPTVVAYEDVVMCMDNKRLFAYSIADGKKLWEHKGAMGFGSAADLLCVDGLAWTIPMTKGVQGMKSSSFLGDGGKEFWGIDVHTGEVKMALDRKLLPGVHHHRCYRNKATEDYLIYGQGGAEFLDLDGDAHSGNLWVRGVCQYGIMPANGLLYVPPDPCRCFSTEKVNGFAVLSAGNSLDDIDNGPELVKGPAYGKTQTQTGPKVVRTAKQERMKWQPPVAYDSADQWPTYRSDITRSGSTESKVPSAVKVAWRTKLGDDLTAITASDGRAFVSSKAEQMLYCLDADTGRTVWQFATPGPVDSPPTISNGLCVFGCRDGSVYCLTADEGELCWRFKHAKIERRTVVDDHFESVWPIDGSVLVLDGVVYFAAGRSTHLDGGITVYGLKLASGEIKYSNLLSAEAAGDEKCLALVDVLVSDGESINMRHVSFDRELNRTDGKPQTTLVSATGLLEPDWFHRQCSSLGFGGASASKRLRGGMGFVARSEKTSLGKMFVFDQSRAYGVKSPYSWLKQNFRPPTHAGHLHQKYSRYEPEWFPVGSYVFALKNETAKKQDPVEWSVRDDFQPRAMVLAGDSLFVAGWLDAVAIQPKTGLPLDPANPDPRSSVLRAVSTADGKIVEAYKLDAEPAFDGMAAAYGKLFVPLKDGTIVCMEGER